MRRLLIIPLIALLAGCAGGPTHDYYNPTVVDGPKFKGPITMALVDDLEAEKGRCLEKGYLLIGNTDYTGKYPEASELRAQAKRVKANHVVYSVKDVSKPGDWHFSFGNWGGSGGSRANNEVRIMFLGR